MGAEKMENRKDGQDETAEIRKSGKTGRMEKGKIKKEKTGKRTGIRVWGPFRPAAQGSATGVPAAG